MNKHGGIWGSGVSRCNGTRNRNLPSLRRSILASGHYHFWQIGVPDNYAGYRMTNVTAHVFRSYLLVEVVLKRKFCRSFLWPGGTDNWVCLDGMYNPSSMAIRERACPG